MQMFHEGKDPYKDVAVTLFGVLYEEVTKKMRTDAKPPVLVVAYGLGKDTLVEYAENMGIKLTLEAGRALPSLRIDRDHPEVTQAWVVLQDAMRATIQRVLPHKFGHVTFIKARRSTCCASYPAAPEITYWKARNREGLLARRQTRRPAAVLVYDGNQPVHRTSGPRSPPGAAS